MMRTIDFLIEKKIVKDVKEFQDLYSVRAFKINDEILIDPNLEINEDENHKIQVGNRIIITKNLV